LLGEQACNNLDPDIWRIKMFVTAKVSGATMAFALLSVTACYADVSIKIGYLEQKLKSPPILYNLEDIPENEGLSGARLGLQDNATTGKFLKHDYSLDERIVEENGDFAAAARELLARTPFIVVNAPFADLNMLADLPEAKGQILFNAGSADVELRDKACRSNILHTLPSRDMLTDALAQFAQTKQWTSLALVSGVMPNDKAYAQAFEKSASKFGLTIVGRKEWAFNSDMRRNAAQEVPLFTQDFEDYQLLVVADEIGDFARYIPFNTWLPRPVAGTEGLVPSGWSPTVEQNGAVQLQNRFKKQFKRTMTSKDYAAWAAVRTIGEAVTRLNGADSANVRRYILSDAFELAGFKGVPMTYRQWNGQLRQPIALTHSRALAALAPLEGFLHERNPLDTLGIDEPESKCENFRK
jgi:ABC transporter substrate binding protein (PQQ-dependent alcohol dehydrogenase system)